MILIALGSNMPFCGRAPQEVIAGALAALERVLTVRRVSRLYRSLAWPDPTDPPFINAAAHVETGLTPEALMAVLHAVEAGFGRRRGRRNGPRTLDLDLIDYNGLIWAGDTPALPVLPHPRLGERDFVLAPLAEIAPDWRDPVTGEAVKVMLDRLAQRAAVPLEAENRADFALQ